MKIELKDLRHVYPTGDEALKGVSTIIEGNEPVAIIGQNGSGKTTLVKHFNGILRPTTGDVVLDGESIKSRSTAKWSKDVGYVFQNPDDQLFLDTVRKELEFGPRQIGMSEERIAERIKVVSELCGLEDKLDEHPFDLTATQKKFCTVGSIIMMDPQVLIFDEPTCGQDVEGTERLCRIIRELKDEGKLCITISHDMKFVVKNFSRAIVLCKGEILLDGKMAEVFAQPEILSEAFVSPPPITRVAQQANFDETVFTIDAFMKVFDRKRGE
jgi:energy-coupling factor transport system ATP-binding protein